MIVDSTAYSSLNFKSKRLLLLAGGALLLLLTGLYCASELHHAGHIISGMNNRVVWGLPHVFAISLIVAASGVLNPASFASVFGQLDYKPWARLSVVMAICLLLGGLAVLVLDLGRPDRLIIALTHWNFKSVFAWNIFLYSGFIAIGLCYLWMLMERRFNQYSSCIGTLAFAWRLVLTTGTGCIFGFLIARDTLDAAILAPMFIALSLVLGNAVFILVNALLGRADSDIVNRTGRSLMWFALALGYFSIVFRLTNAYVEQHAESEQLVLGGSLGWLFWAGHLLTGVIAVVALCLLQRPVIAACAGIVGGFALTYVVVVGSQLPAQTLFPGKVVTDSRFGDMGLAAYTPSGWELGLGLGGVSLAILTLLLAMRVLPLLPPAETRRFSVDSGAA